MRYLTIERRRNGFSIDAAEYLQRLPVLGQELPPGARAFATEPGHYDFHSERFIKNLTPTQLIAGEMDGPSWLELELRHNCWRHEEDLRIRYTGVQELNGDVTGLGQVLLDEVLPHAHGCSHEIAGINGSLIVVCTDLTANWTWAECTERPIEPSRRNH